MKPGTRATRSALLSPPGLRVGVEIAPRRVTAVVVGNGADGPVVAAHATEWLPEEAVVPGLNAVNIANPVILVEALKKVFDHIETRPKRVGLIIPDGVARVSIVPFETVPARAEDLDRLVQWQLRKTVPFRVEDAQLSYLAGMALPAGGREFVVVLARRDLVDEYEQICTRAGAHAGVVDLASFNLINLVLAGRSGAEYGSGDWLLINATREYSTIAIIREGQLIFFRNRPAGADESLADLVHQTAMYYEDRLGGAGFARVILAGAASDGHGAGGRDEMRRGIEERMGARVETVDPREAVQLTDRISAGPELLDALASPIGLILRERTAR